MLIAKIENNAVSQVADYRDLFPNTSFPSSGPDADFLSANGYASVTMWKPHSSLEKLVSTSPYLENGTVYTVVVESKSQADLDAEVEAQWARVRQERTKRLSESDWTQLPDSPLDNVERNLWADYRQGLRDITDQTDPFQIVWPVEPGNEQPSTEPL